MEGKKVFPKDKRYIINTIYDIIELQDGDLMLSDVTHGKVYYKLAMYGYEWELIYTITTISEIKSNVTLRLIGDRQDKEQEIRREFALLEAMLGGGAEVEIVDN